MHRYRWSAFILGSCLLLLSTAVHAADRLEQLPGYDRFKRITDAMDTLAVGGRVQRVQWAEDGQSFTFRRDHDEKRYRFDLQTREIQVIEEPTTAAESQPAAEETVSEDSEATSQPTTAPASQPEVRPTTRPAGRNARRNAPARGRQRDSETSPDGQWIAACRDYNVVIDAAEREETIRVTTNGSRKFRYGKASWVYGEELDQTDAMWWSPDSSTLAFYEFDERQVKDFHLLQGWSELRTEPLLEGYPKPGEPNPIAGLLVFDLASQRTTRIEVGGDLQQYIYNVRWSPDGTELLFSRTNRRQNVLELCAADPTTGVRRVILTETQETWQNNRPEMRFLKDGRRFIWETERTGWKHFELRNLDGSLVNPLTSGEYPVDSIIKVDEERGVMYYMAFSSENPLNGQLHRVSLDGADHRVLTDPMFHHTVRLSNDGRWFIDEYETLETPPATALYSIEGERIATLAESDLSRFTELGLQRPELLVFVADDGVTKLHGSLHKPSNFDPSMKYPLLVEVYGGPFTQGVRNRWSPANAGCEFGYLIAKFENRGGINRGKAFESATYLRLGNLDLKDQADGVRFLCQRPYVDAQRVGIVGSSYGGYMSALAVLRHPEVFHAGIAGSAVTDWRNYDTIYTERYMRTPQENAEGYEESSCMTYVDQLRGRLLIIHGMVDDNVHPTNAWQLIEALNKKSKAFEMMLYPNAGHSIRDTARAVRWEFFYRALIQPFAAPSNGHESASHSAQ